MEFDIFASRAGEKFHKLTGQRARFETGAGHQASTEMMLQVLNEYEKTQLAERQPLPERYLGLADVELDRRITAAKAALGTRVVILGHHYQRDEVIKFADYTGDSFRLSGQVAKHPEAEFIVFCGVHFMAESADVLSLPHQKVILPDLAAGCSMADMAAIDQLETCWEEIAVMGVTGVVPLTYINSSAAIKAFVGERGGIVCTSSNAAATIRWAFERGQHVLFLPDQHLGRNTAYKMGVPLDQMRVWDPHEIAGGLTADDLESAKMILWKGHCSVHERFTVPQIQRIREKHPGVRVIVHPEVPWDVVQAADDSGSTEYIIRQITDGAPGSTWAVGTELHLVNRLAQTLKSEKTVLSLDPIGCLCSTMFRVSPNHLLWVLEGLLDGRVHNRIVVPDDQKHWTKVALDRMLSVR
jgi:quinolinate synthase